MFKNLEKYKVINNIFSYNIKFGFKESQLKMISMLSFLIGAIPMFICTWSHWCMAGHNAHDQLADPIQHVNDLIMLTLMSVGMISILLSDFKKTLHYIFLFLTVGVMFTFQILFVVPLAFMILNIANQPINNIIAKKDDAPEPD
ncbi:MAG: hypothetical protein AB1306_00060 [Nitrospirota bacterium]